MKIKAFLKIRSPGLKNCKNVKYSFFKLETRSLKMNEFLKSNLQDFENYIVPIGKSLISFFGVAWNYECVS
jgi:hypothetical protein